MDEGLGNYDVKRLVSTTRELVVGIFVIKFKCFVFINSYKYTKIIAFNNNVIWVACHHGMVHPQFVHGEDKLQIWRVVVNGLDK
jgi:hypothetical protein